MDDIYIHGIVLVRIKRLGNFTVLTKYWKKDEANNFQKIKKV